MQESYPIKDTFEHIVATFQNALDTDYVVGMLIATAIIAFVLGRLSK
jgi:phosphoenolpyruvate synthase/pyruvate phosphate dikinase